MLIRLVRVLVGLLLRFDIAVLAVHLPGARNQAADALSRFDLPRFKSEVARHGWTTLDILPTPLPKDVGSLSQI